MSAQAGETPSLLLGLPVEILTTIVSLFCAHCYPDDKALSKWDTYIPSKQAKRYRKHFVTLAALSRTCQFFRRISQPILFHCAVPDLDSSWAETATRRASLLCSLVLRPDLGAAVRVLAIADNYRWTLTKHHAISLRQSEIARPLAWFHTQIAALSEGDGNDQRPLTSDQVGSLIFRYCPKATDLILQNWFPRLVDLPDSLSFLQRVVTSGEPHKEEEGEEESNEADDGEFGPAASLEAILTRTPHLESLNCYGLTKGWQLEPKFALTRLTNLSLCTSDMKKTAVRKILQSVPNLTSMEYDLTLCKSGSRNVARIAALMQPIQPSLRTLRLVYRTEEMYYPGSLRSLNRLETLDVEPSASYWSSGDKLMSGVHGEKCLVDFLPVSIKRVTIRNWLDKSALKALTEMIPSTFPEFEQLRIHVRECPYSNADLEALRVAFANSGVSFTVKETEITYWKIRREKPIAQGAAWHSQ